LGAAPATASAIPLFAGMACLGIAAFERDPRKEAKKPLAMTARAKRIYIVALALAAILGVLAAMVTSSIVWILAVQLLPLLLVAANLMLAPFEARVQRRYWSEARDKLDRLQPIVIAITG